LDILEPKVPEDIYKSHLEPNSKWYVHVGYTQVHSDLLLKHNKQHIVMCYC